MVVGGGTMGVGIAESFATAGAAVRIIESSPTAAARATERLASRLPSSSAERVVVTDQWSHWSQARLAIEAVPEDMSLKKNVLRAVEAIVPDSCVLASNTSSLSIDELADTVERPG